MLLRKLVAALCPLLLCVVTCAAFRWLDGWLGAGSFMAFAIKGLLLGAALLALALAYQYLETVGAVHVPLLRAVLSINGQVVLVEGAAAGYLCTTALLYRRR